jgi:putative transposase
MGSGEAMDEDTGALQERRKDIEMDLKPKDRGEAVAIFRSQIIGMLTCRQLTHGELAAELRILSRKRFRPPEAESTRCFAVPTLERWFYAYRRGGLAALRPEPRSDRGYAKNLTPEQRELLLDIRQEHRSASVPLILDTLVAEGRLDKDCVSPPTVRRLLAAHDLRRTAACQQNGSKTRLRWSADRPGALWHGDVCHVTQTPFIAASDGIRIHAFLDDASRYVVALEAHKTEKEIDMLGMLIDALRRHGRPDGLYLDNGSTYRGETLQTACARLGITLIHAKPYDAPARGKMERFWRTLREGCLDYLAGATSLADINARLRAFVEQRYHVAAHASLMGRSPATVYATKPAGEGAVSEQDLRKALTVTCRRRVSRDNVITVDGTAWELDQGYLAGKIITVGYCLVDRASAPWVEHDGKRLVLHRCHPVVNSKRKRPAHGGPAERKPSREVHFDPTQALVDGAQRKNARKDGGDA